MCSIGSRSGECDQVLIVRKPIHLAKGSYSDQQFKDLHNDFELYFGVSHTLVKTMVMDQ